MLAELPRSQIPRLDALSNLDLVHLLRRVRKQEEAIFQKHLFDHRSNQCLVNQFWVQYAGHRLADVPDRFAIVIALTIKNPVHQTLKSPVKGFKEKDDPQRKAEGEQGRRGDGRRLESEIQNRDDQRVGTDDSQG